MTEKLRRVAVPEEYEVPEIDAAHLCSLAGIRTPVDGPPAQPPFPMRRAYFELKRLLEHLGATGPHGMTPTQLATVVMFAYRDAKDIERVPPEPLVKSMQQMIESGEIRSGDLVAVKTKGEYHPGHFISWTGTSAIVLVDGSEVKRKPENMRLPEPGEFTGVVKNINDPLTEVMA